MQPKKIRDSYTVAEIKSWFSAADSDGDGTLSPNEFFMWSLSNNSAMYGSKTIEDIFRRFDADGTGQLDFVEFSAACAKLGFAGTARDIFMDLDEDGSGTVGYRELIDNLRGKVPITSETRNMLTSMIWAYNSGTKEDAVRVMDTSNWVLHGEDAASIRAELQNQLKESGSYVSELMRVFELDTLQSVIDRDEFVNVFRMKLGFKGMAYVLKDCFRSMDFDNSGTIGYCEMYEFVSGHLHALDPRRLQSTESRELKPPPNVELDHILWDVQVLRVLVWQMMQRCKLSTAEVLASWCGTKRSKKKCTLAESHTASMPWMPLDRVRIRGGFCVTTITERASLERMGKRGLSRSDFIHAIRMHYFPATDSITADLWINQVRMVADVAFTEMCDLVRGENFFKEIGILHLDRWIGLASDLTDETVGEYVFPMKTQAQLEEQAMRRELGVKLAERWEQQEAKSMAAFKAQQEELKQQRLKQRTGESQHERPSSAPRKVDQERIKYLAEPRFWKGPGLRPDRTVSVLPDFSFSSYEFEPLRRLERAQTAPHLRSPRPFVVGPPAFGLPASPLQNRRKSASRLSPSPSRRGFARSRERGAELGSKRPGSARRQPIVRYTW